MTQTQHPGPPPFPGQTRYPGPPPAPYGAPPGSYAPPPPAYAPYGYAPPPAPPRRRRTRLIVGVVVGVLALAGLAVGALLLFGSKTLDTAEAQRQIAALTQRQVGVAATAVRCPGDVEVATGTTFSCTGTVDGQEVTFTVRETDDKGNVHIASDSTFVDVAKVEAALRQQVGDRAGVDVVATCDTGGRKVLVDGVGKPISCTVTNADDPTDTLDVTATVDDRGAVSWNG